MQRKIYVYHLYTRLNCGYIFVLLRALHFSNAITMVPLELLNLLVLSLRQMNFITDSFHKTSILYSLNKIKTNKENYDAYFI